MMAQAFSRESCSDTSEKSAFGCSLLFDHSFASDVTTSVSCLVATCCFCANVHWKAHKLMLILQPDHDCGLRLCSMLSSFLILLVSITVAHFSLRAYTQRCGQYCGLCLCFRLCQFRSSLSLTFPCARARDAVASYDNLVRVMLMAWNGLMLITFTMWVVLRLMYVQRIVVCLFSFCLFVCLSSQPFAFSNTFKRGT
jgi:hypothetical protein